MMQSYNQEHSKPEEGGGRVAPSGVKGPLVNFNFTSFDYFNLLSFDYLKVWALKICLLIVI